MKTGISMVELNHKRKVKAANQRKLIKEYEAKIINQREIIKGLQGKSEWVSIDDRLPETDGERFIVYSPHFNTQVRAYYRHHGKRFFGNCGATHWMPLPNPPAEI